MQLTELDLDGSSGQLAASLPYGAYEVVMDLGSGSSVIELPEGADVAMELETGSGSSVLKIGDAVDLNLTVVDAGSGSLTFQIADDSSVRLRVRDDGSGSVIVPDEMDKLKGGGKQQRRNLGDRPFRSRAATIK